MTSHVASRGCEPAPAVRAPEPTSLLRVSPSLFYFTTPLQVIFNFLKKSCKKLHPGTQTKTLTLLCLITCLLLPGYTWIIVLPNDTCTSCSFTHHIPWHHSVCLSHSCSYLLFWGVFCKSVLLLLFLIHLQCSFLKHKLRKSRTLCFFLLEVYPQNLQQCLPNTQYMFSQYLVVWMDAYKTVGYP